LRDSANRQKQEYEDELEVLQEDADEVLEEKASLEEKITILESMLREKENQISSSQSESRSLQREEKAALENKLGDLEARLREKDTQHRKIQNELKTTQRDEKNSLEREIRDLESRMRERESQLRLLQASAKAVQQKAQHEAYDLDAQSQALEKRHVKEINGLAKQIQFLRARCLRAESFREALGYQKRFFLMQIQTYNEWYVDSTSDFTFLSMLTQLQQPGRSGPYLPDGHYP
jgi:chromosome segregation ATPase